MQIVRCEPAHLVEVRRLLTEYARAFDHHICFTSFEQELAALPGDYAPPGGGLWLALADGQLAGCIALRPLAGRVGVGEVKRLFVRPEFRGQRLGLALGRHMLDEARRIGYQRLWLDTLSVMKPAHAVYSALGFNRVPNVEPGHEEEVWCFELSLR